MAGYMESNLGHKLFGCGFGYIRSTDLFSTFLFNIGICGLLVYTWLFLKPVLQLPRNHENTGAKLALVIVYVVSMAWVPEWGYSSSWLFLGIAYARLPRRLAAPAPGFAPGPAPGHRRRGAPRGLTPDHPHE